MKMKMEAQKNKIKKIIPNEEFCLRTAYANALKLIWNEVKTVVSVQEFVTHISVIEGIDYDELKDDIMYISFVFNEFDITVEVCYLSDGFLMDNNQFPTLSSIFDFIENNLKQDNTIKTKEEKVEKSKEVETNDNIEYSHKPFNNFINLNY